MDRRAPRILLFGLLTGLFGVACGGTTQAEPSGGPQSQRATSGAESRADPEPRIDLDQARRVNDQGLDSEEPTHARALFLQACELGLGAACVNAALRLEGEPDRARELLRRACEGGEPAGCHHQAYRLHHQEAREEAPFAEIRALYGRACEAELWESCASLAVLLQEGSGAEADPRQALDLYRRGCEAAHGLSCHRLSRAYLDGWPGARVDPRYAARLRQRACALGWEPSCEADREADRAADVAEGVEER